MVATTIKQNVVQAINDFDEIKAAIESKGVVVPANTPTKDYDDLIKAIVGTQVETMTIATIDSICTL